MQGGHGYYGGRDDAPPHGYGYGYGYGGGYGYGYDAAAYGSAGGYYAAGGGGGYPSAPAAYADPLVGAGQRAYEVPAPLNGLEFQPSETCPKNYVIFDQTCTQSRVMFHPSLAHKLGGGGSSGHCDDYHHHQHQCYDYDYYGGGVDAAQHGKYRDKEDDDSCSGVRQKEDTAEIDALLSSDQDEDDVVSTGRTPCGGDGSSPDSTSSCYAATQKRPKKERMRKMVRTLKGIIPGGSHMDTPAVLDEAVRYLKSLKVEAKKLGVRGASDPA